MPLLTFCWVFRSSLQQRILAGSKELAPRIRREAVRSLELDPTETDPHLLLGSLASVHDYDWQEAAKEFRLALATPSPPAEAHWAYAALYLGVFGHFDESSAAMRRAVEQDPLNVNWRGVLVAHLVNAGRYDEALREGLRALNITQTEIHPFLGIGEAYLALGRVAEAAASAEKAHRNFPQHSMATGLLAACLVRLGEKQRAEALVQEMGDTPNPLWGRAWFHLLCSEIDAAAGWYEKMIETRDVFAVIYANSPYTQELRASPHWAKLARMMNLILASDYARGSCFGYARGVEPNNDRFSPSHDVSPWRAFLFLKSFRNSVSDTVVLG